MALVAIAPGDALAASSHAARTTRRHVRVAKMRSAPAPRRAAFGSGVYGASAPYYLEGPGNGGGYAYDPIGGPNHVGNGGPAANLGGSATRFTDAQARYLAGWR